MQTKTRSFAYTRDVLRSLTKQAFEEVARLGGNKGVEAILKKLVVEDPPEEEVEVKVVGSPTGSETKSLGGEKEEQVTVAAGAAAAGTA
jgi:hypothetical protein